MTLSPCSPGASLSRTPRREASARQFHRDALPGGSREQQQVAVGIAHDESARAPRLLLQGLLEVDPGRLVLDEELTDLGGAVRGSSRPREAARARECRPRTPARRPGAG